MGLSLEVSATAQGIFCCYSYPCIPFKGYLVLCFLAVHLLNILSCVRDLGQIIKRHTHGPPTPFRWLPGIYINTAEKKIHFYSEWSNISQQELANLAHFMKMGCTVDLKAAGGHNTLTSTYWLQLLILTPLCSGTHYPISVWQMSVKFVLFMFVLSYWSFLCSNIFAGKQ